MFVHFFFLSTESRDGHIAGLMEAKPEKLGKIYPNIEKMCHSYALQFCIHANFLSVHPVKAL